MRILLPTPDYPPKTGGVARYLQAIAKQFGDDVTVITKGFFSRWMLPHWLPVVFLLLRKARAFDLILTSHVLPIGTACFLTRAITGKPYGVIVHGMDLGLLRGRKRWLAKRVLAKAEFVVANSQALAKELSDQWGVSSPVVCYPSLEPAFAETAKQLEPIAGIPKGLITLSTVGRLVERKNHLAVLRAIHILNQEGIRVRYLIAGSGPMLDEIRRVISTLHLEGVVQLIEGPTDEELLDLYRSTDLFVMPTINRAGDREGFGIVYLEANAFGIPVIASDAPGVNEAVLDGETGVS
jgi:phosphatidylinositol alpha-1,6-mannosyltransferase